MATATMTTQVAIRLPQAHTLTAPVVMAGAVTSLLVAARQLWRLDNIAFNAAQLLETAWGTTYYLSTAAGQGLPSWVVVHYGSSGPYAPKDLTYSQAWPDSFLIDMHERAIPACDFMINYNGSRSQSELHAHAIHLLRRWIAERGGSLLWNMAPESQWHPFEDRAQWARLAENRRWMPARPSWMQAQ
ncbi:Uncharacterised protein [Mycobacteroides abscessus subsp. massiliense]|uniref:Uncharacterized protein n=1 Tax=Mycobacteroides abscessus subsp. massiliense TaxID=1962118 RepID=A0A1T8VF95_9MYCO|nr:hypothetical protein [Mycobacteroides abscessus]SKN03548.1 Uncharacterised protein [Mycobacteroides abscessus subsp. massiliense]